MSTASPAGTDAARRYTQLELFRVQRPPQDLAVTATKIFLVQVEMGARPSDVTGVILEAPLDGGASPREVPGSRTEPGVGILGVTVVDDALFMSASTNGPDGVSGVFRVANPPVAIAGGTSKSTNRQDNGDGGAATAAVVQGPQGLTFTSAGDLFIAETGDSRIRLVRSGTISTYAGTGACTGAAPPSGLTKTTALCNPGLVAAGRGGVLYVAQRVGLSWIVGIDAAGVITPISNEFPIAGLAVDVDGSVLVADARAGRIVRIDRTRSPNAITVVACSLGLIRGLAVGTDGSIYFASSQTSSPAAADWRVFRLRPVP